jgi:hypothetical protein
MAQIPQISKKRNFESPDLYDKLQYVAKNIERFFLWGFFFPTFIAKIWRNYFLKDRHSNSIPNSCKETLELAEFINFITLVNTFWDSHIILLDDGRVGI